VDFYTGKSFTVSPQFPDNNEKVVRPEITESQCAGDTLLGWNTGEGTAYWDFDKNVYAIHGNLFFCRHAGNDVLFCEKSTKSAGVAKRQWRLVSNDRNKVETLRISPGPL